MSFRLSLVTTIGAVLLAVLLAACAIGTPVDGDAKSHPGDDLFGGDEERVYPDVGEGEVLALCQRKPHLGELTTDFLAWRSRNHFGVYGVPALAGCAFGEAKPT